MICKISEEQLIAYSFDELSLDQQLDISKHVASCTNCQNKLEELNILQNAWNTPSQFTISEKFTDSIMGMINEQEEQEKQEEHQGHLKINFFKQGKLKTISHVLIASAATVALVYSGVFSELPNTFASLTSIYTDASNNLHLITIQSTAWLYNMDISNYINPFKF